MSAALALPIAYAAATAVLRERISFVEKSLLETRTKVLVALDQELSTLRGCLASIEASVQSSGTPSGAPGMDQLMQNAPQYQVDNTIAMNPSNPSAQSISEAELDPRLVQATVDELNAALAAAFNQVSER